MSPTKKRTTKEINDFIIYNVRDNPSNIARVTAEKFGISRVAAVKRLQSLIKDGVLIAEGKTKARSYQLEVLDGNKKTISLDDTVSEDDVWIKDIKPHISQIPPNVLGICAHGFTEMLNNAIDHSESTTTDIVVGRTAAEVILLVEDYGVGIFNKIQQAFHLSDPHQSILELTKGKITTDRTKHTGEGIFFTSRMFDEFVIQSGNLVFTRHRKSQDWIMDSEQTSVNGTRVIMKIATNATHSAEEIFNQYRSEFDEFGFSRTNIPLILLKYEGEQLISRSQAKRLMARVDRFQEVLLDFKGISSVGQAFADEIFRIYRREHPHVQVLPINASEDVLAMIRRVLSDNGEDFDAYREAIRKAKGWT
ncbi:MAG: histidine kinase [Nitrospira sp.]